ncbi:MAG: hypothetical protein JRJ01_16345 [Deltaproteobacteria bacterium]|nr:hypothetical protein [Deltaproteobacteria bacterium]
MVDKVNDDPFDVADVDVGVDASDDGDDDVTPGTPSEDIVPASEEVIENMLADVAPVAPVAPVTQPNTFGVAGPGALYTRIWFKRTSMKNLQDTLDPTKPNPNNSARDMIAGGGWSLFSVQLAPNAFDVFVVMVK